MLKLRLSWSSAWIVVVLLALSGVTYAQTTYATITGTVTDPSGTVVAKATLTATNVATGVTSTTTSNAAGAYTIAQLNEGTYTLKAEASGFKEFVLQDVKVVSGAVRRVDVLLQLSAAATAIEVSAGHLYTAIRSVSCNPSINGPAVGLFNRGNRTSPVMPQGEPAGYGS